MTIYFPPDPEPEQITPKTEKRSLVESESSKEVKKLKDDPSVIEIRLCDSDDDSTYDESADASTLSTQSSTTGSIMSPSKGVDAVEGTKKDIVKDVQNCMYDEDMTAGEISTMIQRSRVMMDFFAAGQMSKGRPFSEKETEKVRNNISSGTFFSNPELDRVFKQVLLLPSVCSFFAVLTETIATIFYTEEEIRTDFLPQYMTRAFPRSVHLGKPLRHYRSFQRCFMVTMGFKDPYEFDKVLMMRRVTKDLCRCRKHGFASTKMMSNNRSAAFKLTETSAPSSNASSFYRS